MLLSILLKFAATAQAQFTYVTNGGALKITGYSGTDANLVIPAATNGYPVTGIATNVFVNDTYVTNVVIPASVTYIGTNAFGACANLTSVTVPGAITNETAPNYGVYVQVFQKDPIANISISPGSTYVIALAFSGFAPYNKLLTNISIPYGVTDIQPYAFNYTGNFTNLNVTLPESLVNIGMAAFGMDPKLPTITIPASVTNIDFNAFNGDTALTNVLFEGGRVAMGIGGQAFYNCVGLQNLVLTNGTISIGTNAFANCTGLTNVIIGTNATYIGVGAFMGCSSLVSVTVPGAVTNGLTTIDNNVYSYIFYGSGSGPSIANVNIAAGSTYITTNAFVNWGETSVNIPYGVTNIQRHAFANDPELQTVAIPNSVTIIGESAFLADPLNSVQLPNRLTSIGVNAFFACGFNSITIPGSVTNLGSSAFQGCGNLGQVYFTGNAPDAGTDTSVFSSVAAGAMVYYLPGTTGWGPVYDGLPTALWNPQAGGFSTSGGQFGFTITGPTNASIVVVSCTNLAQPVWVPVATNILSASGTALFSDPQWTNHPTRFYRFTTP
jgi:hypothetical protein